MPLIGRMRDRVSIQSETRTSDGRGGYTKTWTTLATVWAQISPLRAAEQVEAGALQGVTVFRATIRYRDDVTTPMRVLWGSRVFNIRGITNTDERKRFTELLCEEKVTT